MTRFILAVDGFGAAGKSTLAAKLQKALPNSTIVEVDYFCYPPSGKEGEWWGNDRIEEGVDWRRLRDQVIIPFCEGKKNIGFTRLNWDSYGQDPAVLANADILIVEGMHSLHKGLREYVDFGIWIESDDEGRVDRVINRDGVHMADHWHNEFIPIGQRYLKEHDPKGYADVVFNVLQATDADFDVLLKKVTAALRAPAPKMVLERKMS